MVTCYQNNETIYLCLEKSTNTNRLFCMCLQMKPSSTRCDTMKCTCAHRKSHICENSKCVTVLHGLIFICSTQSSSTGFLLRIFSFLLVPLPVEIRLNRSTPSQSVTLWTINHLVAVQTVHNSGLRFTVI